MNKGLIHIYCGDGKGKTTAAIGLAVRAAGRGFKVIFAQFLKSSPSGELEGLKTLGIKVLRGALPPGFTWEMTEEELKKVKTEHDKLFSLAVSEAGQGEKTLLILDEMAGAFDNNLIDRKKVLEFLDSRPEALELVITGRNPGEDLNLRGDYITEMKKIKHPMDRGVNARVGIEM